MLFIFIYVIDIYLCYLYLFMLLIFIYVIDIYSCYWYLFTYISVQHDFHIKWCSCRLTVTQRVSPVEQELPTIP
jgi:hypothetical protein